MDTSSVCYVCLYLRRAGRQRRSWQAGNANRVFRPLDAEVEADRLQNFRDQIALPQRHFELILDA